MTESPSNRTRWRQHRNADGSFGLRYTNLDPVDSIGPDTISFNQTVPHENFPLDLRLYRMISFSAELKQHRVVWRVHVDLGSGEDFLGIIEAEDAMYLIRELDRRVVEWG